MPEVRVSWSPSSGWAVDVLPDGDELGGELLGHGLDLLLEGRRGVGGGPGLGRRGENGESGQDQGGDGEATVLHGFLLQVRGSLW